MSNQGKPRTAASRAVELSRDDLACFATLMRRRLEFAPLHEQIIKQLERIESGAIDRLMIFVPPRHGKSLISSELFPAWYLGKHPDRSVIAASYGQELASDFGRKVRNHMAGGIFRTVFPTASISPDSSAAHRFNLMAGGAYYAVGAGGALTGRGADLLIIDDPVKNREDADSATYRRNLHDYYESVAYTRLQPGGAVVLIQTRWHDDDLAGWLLREHAAEAWTVVSLPAIAEPNDPLGREEGAALWPQKFPVPTLNRIREAIGSAAWASLYQQRPVPATGSIFKREWWRHYSAASLPPKFESVLLSLDTAFKTNAQSDYSVALVLGVGETGYFILDLWRARAEFPRLKAIVNEMAAKWRPDRLLIEDAASGQSLIQELRQSSRLPVMPIKVGSDKVSRAHAVTPMIESGRVYLPEAAPWLSDFIDELSSFPAAAHDDQTDSLTQALNYVRESADFGSLIGFYRDEAAREAFSVSANYATAAAAVGMTIAEVQTAVQDGDPSDLEEVYDQAYREAAALHNGTTALQSSTYGDRRREPTNIGALVQKNIGDIMRGKV
jgi:predicted phage terminase large subunit-like protein